MDVDLLNKCIDIIIHNQQPSGSFVASLTFSTYNYCWLRDGSFTAYCMDLYKRYDSSKRFFDWVDMAISRQCDKAAAAVCMRKQGRTLLNSDYLPARYRLDGGDVDDDWPNFQLDGYGIWLWAFNEHIRAAGNTALIDKYQKSLGSTIDYLINLWDTPCFDCWQENGDRVHTSTLACIYGGLKSINEHFKHKKITEVVNAIKKYILDNCIFEGRLVKYKGSCIIDASLLWVSTPFGVLREDHPVMIETVKHIYRTQKKFYIMHIPDYAFYQI